MDTLPEYVRRVDDFDTDEFTHIDAYAAQDVACVVVALASNLLPFDLGLDAEPLRLECACQPLATHIVRNDDGADVICEDFEIFSDFGDINWLPIDFDYGRAFVLYLESRIYLDKCDRGLLFLVVSLNSEGITEHGEAVVHDSDDGACTFNMMHLLTEVEETLQSDKAVDFEMLTQINSSISVVHFQGSLLRCDDDVADVHAAYLGDEI